MTAPHRENHLSELELAYQRIDELTLALRKIIAAYQNRKLSDWEFRMDANYIAGQALSLWRYDQ